jgi:oligoendopeptidase F
MKRSEQKLADTWDLTPLFKNEAEWTKAITKLEAMAHELNKFKGRLAESVDTFADYLDLLVEYNMLGDRVSEYMWLQQCEDGGNVKVQAMERRLSSVGGRLSVLLSWRHAQTLAIPEDQMKEYFKNPRLKDYKVFLKRVLRGKEHALNEVERAVESQLNQNAGQADRIFSVFTDTDMRFPDVNGQKLSQGTYGSLMENPDRKIRKETYDKFYAEFDKYKNTISALYANSVKEDWVYAKLHKFNSTLDAKLFGNNVPKEVYMNLIATVNKNLPMLHRFYDFKAKLLGLKKLARWDVYAPTVDTPPKVTPYDDAVDIVAEALAPLGEEYVTTLKHGLTDGRWVDRYENEGKRSGAFSAGIYTSPPYMLLNYKEGSFRDISTMAHEGGHSMHTWYSSHSQPYMQYDYTIFGAEVASTVNEQLLTHYLLDHTTDKNERAYIICKHLDELSATLFRQTMFAEFELRAHEIEEAGEALTVETIRGEYRKLLEKYFGPNVELPEIADLEALRIPHFYNPYYVYQYATGISAAVALAKRILSGEEGRLDYFKFLKSGGSVYPIDSLKLAGVDMSQPEPIQAACDEFATSLDELEKLLS